MTSPADRRPYAPGSPLDVLAVEFHSGERCDCHDSGRYADCYRWATNILNALRNGGYDLTPLRKGSSDA